MKPVELRWVVRLLASGALLVACGEAAVAPDDSQIAEDSAASGRSGAAAKSGSNGGEGEVSGTGGNVNAASGGGEASGGSAAQGVGGTRDLGAGGSVATGGSTSRGGTNAGNCDVPALPTKPVGFGEKTTGGGNATPVVVNTLAAAEAALADYRAAFKAGTQSALVLRYTGTFNFGSITDVCAQHMKAGQRLSIKEMSNVTLIGAAGSSANFGVHINKAKNIIVRNMTMGLLPGGDESDAISIEGNGTSGDVENVWIDHNELFSSTKSDCDGAGDTEFDGLIDVKKGARRITISYNHLHDHQKTGLLGSSDTDDTERYITFHHNWYENVVSRSPLHRFGYVHLYNNYYSQITSSGINVRMGGVALIEANYFENVANPVTSRYSDGVGFWDLVDNYVGSGITWTVEADTLANADDWSSTKTFPTAELNYSYTPDTAECVKELVTMSAGAILSL